MLGPGAGGGSGFGMRDLDGALALPAPRMVETRGLAVNPGALRMLSYAPQGLAPKAALVVVLHGCGQRAEAIAADSGWLALAERWGFAVLAPEQSPLNNANGCFNWFRLGDTRRGRGEAASIAAMVAEAVQAHALDPGRVFVTGFSAGGAMAAVMLAAYPDLFAGAGVIAGTPYGLARGVGEALMLMRQPGAPDIEALGHLVRRAAIGVPAQRLRLSIWHGDADGVVDSANGWGLARQWAAASGLPPEPRKTIKTPGRTRSIWGGGGHGARVELNIVHGLGHGAPLSTLGETGLGRAAPFMLEAGVSSTLELARAWGLERKSAKPGAAQGASEPRPAGWLARIGGWAGAVWRALQGKP